MARAPLAELPSRPRTVAYLGNPQIAVPPLRALVSAGFELPIVVTAAPKRRGRGSARTPTPVHAAATELGLTVAHSLDELDPSSLDMAMVVAFGELIRRPMLERLAMLNMHFSDLPRWRGAAPVERAVMAGDRTTAVCLMAVEVGLDTGGVFARRPVEIGPEERASDLAVRLTAVGSELLVETLLSGLGTPQPQEGEAMYAAKLGPADFVLDPDRPAAELYRASLVAPLVGWFRGRRVRVHEARPVAGIGAPGTLVGTVLNTLDGGLELLTIQAEGKPTRSAADWRNGAQPGADETIRPKPDSGAAS